MADALNRRVQTSEARNNAAIEQVAASIDQKLESRRQRPGPGAWRSWAREIARITEKLAERIGNAERRNALAIDDVGDQVTRVTDRLNQRHERTSQELVDRIRQSEERTARLLEEAREKIDTKLARRPAPPGRARPPPRPRRRRVPPRRPSTTATASRSAARPSPRTSSTSRPPSSRPRPRPRPAPPRRRFRGPGVRSSGLPDQRAARARIRRRGFRGRRRLHLGPGAGSGVRAGSRLRQRFLGSRVRRVRVLGPAGADRRRTPAVDPRSDRAGPRRRPPGRSGRRRQGQGSRPRPRSRRLRCSPASAAKSSTKKAKKGGLKTALMVSATAACLGVGSAGVIMSMAQGTGPFRTASPRARPTRPPARSGPPRPTPARPAPPWP